MQEQIKTLEDQIKEDIEAIKAKRLMLRALRKEEAKRTPFSKTTLGKAYFTTIQTITQPFASLHRAAKDQVEHPFAVQNTKYKEQTTKLLERAQKCDRENNEKRANKMTLQLASFVMELEDFVERHDLFATVHKDGLDELRSEVERLRPPRDEAKVEEFKNMMGSLVQGQELANA